VIDWAIIDNKIKVNTNWPAWYAAYGMGRSSSSLTIHYQTVTVSEPGSMPRNPPCGADKTCVSYRNLLVQAQHSVIEKRMEDCDIPGDILDAFKGFPISYRDSYPGAEANGVTELIDGSFSGAWVLASGFDISIGAPIGDNLVVFFNDVDRKLDLVELHEFGHYLSPTTSEEAIRSQSWALYQQLFGGFPR